MKKGMTESSNCFQHVNKLVFCSPWLEPYLRVFSVFISTIRKSVSYSLSTNGVTISCLFFYIAVQQLIRFVFAFSAVPKSISQSLLISQPPMVRIKIDILCVFVLCSVLIVHMCVFLSVFSWYHLDSGFHLSEQQMRGQFLSRKAGQTEQMKV